MSPLRRPLARAARFDGVVPIASDGGPLAPDALAAYLEPMERPPGFDVVCGRVAGPVVQGGVQGAGVGRLPDEVGRG